MDGNTAADAALELDALIPENQVALATGEQLTLHEYTFMEGMRVDTFAGPLIKELQDLFMITESEGDDIRLQDLASVFGFYQELIPELIAISCNRAPEWVRGLSDQDGQFMLMAWWTVNRDFFVRRLVAEASAKLVLHQAGAESSLG